MGLDSGGGPCSIRLPAEHRKHKTYEDRAEDEATTGDEVREVFEAMLPQAEIERRCQQFGVIERQRKLTLGMFMRAMVISAGTPGGALPGGRPALVSGR